MLALFTKHMAAVENLLEDPQTVNINAANREGTTALHIAACHCGDPAMDGCIEALCEAGADPLAANRGGMLPLDMVSVLGRRRPAGQLLARITQAALLTNGNGAQSFLNALSFSACVFSVYARALSACPGILYHTRRLGASSSCTAGRCSCSPPESWSSHSCTGCRAAVGDTVAGSR
jgi:ankyrin repeat protein